MRISALVFCTMHLASHFPMLSTLRHSESGHPLVRKPCLAVQVHNLSGPFRVEDTKGKPAMPGDLLVVEILDLGPLEGHEWGFTGIFDRENGGGFLTDHFPEACKAIWDFEGIYCSSRHVPGRNKSVSPVQQQRQGFARLSGGEPLAGSCMCSCRLPAWTFHSSWIACLS